MDGAEWIDGFVDRQCKEAVRILDFAHAAEYVNQIGQLAQAAGSLLPQDWLPSLLHGLKHNGPSEMLRHVQQLRDRHPDVEEIAKKSRTCRSVRHACSIPTIKPQAGQSAPASWKVAIKWSCRHGSKGLECIGTQRMSTPCWPYGPVPAMTVGMRPFCKDEPICINSVSISVVSASTNVRNAACVLYLFVSCS